MEHVDIIYIKPIKNISTFAHSGINTVYILCKYMHPTYYLDSYETWCASAQWSIFLDPYCNKVCWWDSTWLS